MTSGKGVRLQFVIRRNSGSFPFCLTAAQVRMPTLTGEQRRK